MSKNLYARTSFKFFKLFIINEVVTLARDKNFITQVHDFPLTEMKIYIFNIKCIY